MPANIGLTRDQILRFAAMLEAQNAPTSDGFYYVPVHPVQLGLMVVDSMAEATADRWRARERELGARR